MKQEWVAFEEMKFVEPSPNSMRAFRSVAVGVGVADLSHVATADLVSVSVSDVAMVVIHRKF
jgi:hypothetical protein